MAIERKENRSFMALERRYITVIELTSITVLEEILQILQEIIQRNIKQLYAANAAPSSFIFLRDNIGGS